MRYLGMFAVAHSYSIFCATYSSKLNRLVEGAKHLQALATLHSNNSADTIYKLITLALVSYLRSSVVGALHRHRKGVGSIPAGGPIVDEFFSTVLGLNLHMCIIFHSK